jgi:hypothetical protein
MSTLCPGGDDCGALEIGTDANTFAHTKELAPGHAHTILYAKIVYANWILVLARGPCRSLQQRRQFQS